MLLALGMDGFHITFAQSAGDTRHPGRPGKLVGGGRQCADSKKNHQS